MTTDVITKKEYQHYYHYVLRKGDPYCAAISSNTITGAEDIWLFSMMPEFCATDEESNGGLEHKDTYLTPDEFAIIAMRHMKLMNGTYENSTD